MATSIVKTTWTAAKAIATRMGTTQPRCSFIHATYRTLRNVSRLSSTQPISPP